MLVINLMLRVVTPLLCAGAELRSESSPKMPQLFNKSHETGDDNGRRSGQQDELNDISGRQDDREGATGMLPVLLDAPEQ